MSFNPIISVPDDGLAVPEVGSWSKDKYNLVGRYCDIFTNSMRNKWSQLVYADLFSGSGCARIKDTNQVLLGSPLIALSIPHPFTKYIFCEQDEELFNSLSTRVARDFPKTDVTLIKGDSNKIVDKIKKSMPPFSKTSGVLSFCFADPFSLDLHFDTIRSLGVLKMDFLILLALHMDANRNYENYLKEENTKIDLFLGDRHWRNVLKEKKIKDNETFVRFLANTYRDNMAKLEYNVTESFHQVRSDKRNLPLYYLAFFSKNDLGDKFWKEIKKYSSPQTKLNL